MPVRWPIKPNPVTSVPELTPTSSIASDPARFDCRIKPTAPATISASVTSALAAVEMMPVPMGLVSTSLSPGLAFAFVTILSGAMRPVTAMPYFGSASFTVCPPAMSTPASLAASAPPSKMRPRIFRSRSSGKQTMFKARIGFPPIAYTSLNAFTAAITPKS